MPIATVHIRITGSSIPRAPTVPRSAQLGKVIVAGGHIRIADPPTTL
jgi:hypothetical protein